MIKKRIVLASLLFIKLLGYDLPVTINLGYSNILEGGPIRPTHGFYWYQYFNSYHAKKFTDNCGKPLASPLTELNAVVGATQLIYQTEKNYLLNAKLGIDVIWYYDFYSKINAPTTLINTSGTGASDPYAGLYLQWDPIMRGDRPIFVHRLELAASFPAGKYKTGDLFNPGNGFYYINPNWAATLFFTEHLATSLHLHYIWSSKNKHTGITAGQAMSFNYSLEYELIKNFWVAVNGYYLNQFTNSRFNHSPLPGRKERVFSIGPAALYSPNDDLYFFMNLYFESQARNRPQGVSFLLRSVVHF
jgi:anthranilate 1,2-dioxygenase (deaminating, decarboxylating) large subunit